MTAARDAAAAPRLRLPAGARVRARRDFQRVYQRGLRASGRWLTVVVLRTRDQGPARVGLSVSKDHGSAVRRNKIKRLLREAFRHERAALPRALDVVLIPRPTRDKLLLAVLRLELVELVGKALATSGRPRPRRSRP